MTLYAPRYPQLLQGVSQQDEHQRAVGQMHDQFNCISDLVQGLRRRPRFKLLNNPIIAHNAEIDGASRYTCHYYERGDGIEAYIIIITDTGTWQVYNAYTGAAVSTIQYPSGSIHNYITTADPRNDLTFCTVGDTTFLANKTIPVTRAPFTSDVSFPGVLIWVKRWSFGKDYDVKVSGSVVATVAAIDTATVTATTVDKRVDLKASLLASQLSTNINTAGYYAGSLNNVIYMPCDGRSSTTTVNPALVTIDDNAGTADMTLIYNEVDSFEDLPPCAPDGFVVKVTGLGNSQYDDYYVEFQSEGGTNWESLQTTEGKWVECATPTESKAFDPIKFPVKIVRQFSGADPEFVMIQSSGEARAAGDDDTNPFPSFTGNTINDMFVYKNRLWILSGENACATRAFNYTNWFAASAASPSDEDPIDTSSSDSEITNLLYGVVNNNDLLIFSNKSQFLWDGTADIKPSTFSLEAAAKYPVKPVIKPIPFGDSVICPTAGDDRFLVWEFTKDPVSGKPVAADLTQHIGNYISNAPRIKRVSTTEHEIHGIESIAMHPAKGMLFIVAGGEIYVLQTSKRDRERVQLAWHKWQIAQMPEHSWAQWTDTGFIEHPTVSDVFVLENRLLTIARFDQAVSSQYHPRFLSAPLDLKASSVENTEVFMDMAFNSAEVDFTNGPWEFDGEFYNARALVPYYFNPDDDNDPPGDEREAYWDSVVIGENVSYKNDDSIIRIFAGYKLPLGYTFDTANRLLYFNLPTNYTDGVDSFKLRLGCKYDSYFALTNPYVKDSKGFAYTESTIIDDVVMDMADTVYWEADIENNAGDGYTHVFNGNVLNDFQYKLGVPNHVTRPETVVVCNLRDLSRITIRSGYSLHGFKFSGCTWHVNMHTNGRRA